MPPGGGLAIRITVHDEEVVAGLRAIRSQLRQDVKRITGVAAEREVRPVARRLAPRIVQSTVVTRSNTGGAWLSTNARGKKRAIFILLNDGGVVRSVITPKSKKALAWGGAGHPVSRVTSPRKFRGKHFLEKAVTLSLGRYSDSVENQLHRIMSARITGASTFGVY